MQTSTAPRSPSRYLVDHPAESLNQTPAQIEGMGLPTAPPKKTDRRSFDGLTTQAEAIPPRRLREIVIDAVTSRMDSGIYDALLQREAAERESMIDWLASR